MKPPAEDPAHDSRVVRLPSAEHAELKELLPWYVTGRLEPAEQARVEAHLTGCRRCRADVAFQRRLGAEVASLPLEAEHSWARLKRQIESEDRRPWRRLLDRLTGGGWWVAGATLAAATLAVTVVPPMSASTPAPNAEYRALSAAGEPKPAGDLVVVFREDATEREVREALKASGARVVDGPTAADAFVLDTPAGQRDAALARLQESGVVTLAEPLAMEGAPR